MTDYQAEVRPGRLASLFGGSFNAVIGSLALLFTLGVFGTVAWDA